MSTIHSPSDAALVSWIGSGNFIVVLAMGPIFVSLDFFREVKIVLNIIRALSVIVWERNGSLSVAPS